MIQETHMEETPKLPGYHVHASPPSARTSNTGAAQGVCTFVRKGITLIKLDRFLDGNTALELCATEVVVGKKTQESVCLMNAYSNPQHRSQRFRTLFQKARRKAEIAPTIEDLEKWTRSLVDAVARVSTEVETEESIPTMDPRLAHLIEARQSLQRRWKRMRHNRTLRKRIAHLGREIEKYSTQLCVQQWHAICNEADGQLHASRTWKLLRHLRDETQSKSFQQHRLAQILHAAIKEHGEDEVGKRLIDQYLPATAQVRHPDYEGTENPALDADIEEWESTEKEAANITLWTEDGTTIPHVRGIRVLGMHFDAGNGNHTALSRLLTKRVGLRPPRAEPYCEEAPKREEVSKQVARRLVVLPLPRNVHPDRNKERRVARARALAETYADDAKAVYVDAAKHQRKPKTYVAAVVRATDGKVLNACSVRATSAEQAEEAAIALALSGIPGATTILSDSRTAIANFARGSVGTPAASLLPKTKSTTTHLRWFPAHVGVIPGGAANRNEEADVVARELAYRAAPPRPSEADEADFLDPDPLLDYGGILVWYREGRRALPGPHPRLGRREGVLLRQLQTGTVLTPALARHVCPGLFESATCSVCARELATLAHVLWGCDACAGGTVRDSLPPDMEHYISSPDHQAQLQAIQRLDAALARQKRTEATPSS
ncbi:hypothetical protein HPB49_010600 [Dermacentor silvarum]|uniref:Uncharacterized protein n=1 Tax=Dermacentor silvarum TaxID=543639 RepID=A0ACB8CWG5_DERSI|nr:hypothetical protein HPB49_010600 [Dermacentor silvarum]